MTQSPDDDSFAAVLAVVRGERRPMTLLASKVLRYMLRCGNGCDVRITPTKFVVVVGPYSRPVDYFVHIAPAVVSELLRSVENPAPRARAVLGVRTVAAVGPMDAWSYGPHAVWLDATDDAVPIAVRPGLIATEAWPLAFPLPPPIPRVDRDFDPPLTCPHCLAIATRYRQLSCGSLVCPACARSFQIS